MRNFCSSFAGGCQIFRNLRDETRLWLRARHPMLGNARAIDLINSVRREEVLAVIEALDSEPCMNSFPAKRCCR